MSAVTRSQDDKPGRKGSLPGVGGAWREFVSTARRRKPGRSSAVKHLRISESYSRLASLSNASRRSVATANEFIHIAAMNADHLPPARALSRRDFITQAALGASAVALSTVVPKVGATENLYPPIVVFSKVYQTLSLNFDDAAEVTAEAGLDGVDPPLRPEGEILPERANEDLPRYVEAMHKRKLQLPLLTTAIVSTTSPHTEDILRAAKKSGVQFYRVGFIDRKGDSQKQVSEFKAQLKDLAALNKQIGIGALIQNHSPAGHGNYLGGDLNDMREIVSGFDPSQIGVAFDIGHAIIVHKEEWRPRFETLKSHIKVVYVKDAKMAGRWVPFGEGDVGHIGYFKLLKEMGYNAPISMHIEFDWTQKGKTKTREALVKTLKESAGVLRKWLMEA
jgi:L-ribulose-5-phosphate 3-epimerase